MRRREPSRLQRLLNGAVDAVVEAVAPEKAARRQAWRKNGHLLARMGGAAGGRLIDWPAPSGDANAVTLDHLPKVRQRARDAALNNPIYLSVRETMVQHVVGSQGIVPRSMVDHERLGITPAQAEQWQGACNELWRSRVQFADVTGRQQSWGGLLRLIYRSGFDGGDVFPSFPLRAWPGLGVMPRINLIEAERVETPLDRISDPTVRGGVQLGKWGEPLGFHVLRAHPGDVHARPSDILRTEYWAREQAGRTNILQVYQQDRVGQARGAPRLHSVLDLIDQVEQYADTTLLAAEMQTRMSFWIHTMADPNDVAAAYDRTDQLREEIYGAKFQHGVEPASVNVLHAGDKVETVGQTAPGGYFDPFVIRLLKLVTAVTKAPYSIVFGDSLSENYSSMRRQWQSFRHTVDCEQDALMPLCRTFWSLLLYEAWLDGQLLPGESWVRFEDAPDLWAAAAWTKPVLGAVDPTKETKSLVEAIDAGIRSPQSVIAENGGDPDQVLNERKAWKDEEARRGLTSGSAAPAAAVGEEEDEEETDAEDQDEDPGDDTEDEEVEQDELEEART